MKQFTKKLIKSPYIVEQNQILDKKVEVMMKNPFFQKLIKNTSELENMTGSTRTQKS